MSSSQNLFNKWSFRDLMIFVKTLDIIFEYIWLYMIILCYICIIYYHILSYCIILYRWNSLDIVCRVSVANATHKFRRQNPRKHQGTTACLPAMSLDLSWSFNGFGGASHFIVPYTGSTFKNHSKPWSVSPWMRSSVKLGTIVFNRFQAFTYFQHLSPCWFES